MKILKSQRVLAVPEGVEVSLKARKITVKGPRGTLSRDFTHVPHVDMVYDKENNQIVCTMFFSTRKRLSSLRTLCSHMSNCFDGCLLYTSPSPRDQRGSRMPSSA